MNSKKPNTHDKEKGRGFQSSTSLTRDRCDKESKHSTDTWTLKSDKQKSKILCCSLLCHYTLKHSDWRCGGKAARYFVLTEEKEGEKVKEDEK
ncbi:uncharacterized [Tachysurus ichikawai]